LLATIWNRGRACVSAGDATEAATWLFLSLEAAIVSVADKHGRRHSQTAVDEGDRCG
jgi:hypothetical protein